MGFFGWFKRGYNKKGSQFANLFALRLGLFSHQFLVDLDRFWQLRDCLPKLDR